MRYLTNAQIRKLWWELIAIGVNVNMLLAQIDGRFASTLARGGAPAEDMWIVLNQLSSVERIENGTVPLVDVLGAAYMFARLRGSGALVLELLAGLREQMPSDCKGLHEDLGDFDVLSRRRGS